MYQIGKLSIAGDLTLFWGFPGHTSLKWTEILISPSQNIFIRLLQGCSDIAASPGGVSIHEYELGNQTARKPSRPFVCPALWQGFIDGQGFIDVETLVL